MTTLEQVAEITGGGTPPRAEASYFGGGICWATPTDVTALQDLYIQDTRETLTPAGLAGSSARLLPAGAVLLTSRATIGFTAVSKVPISTNQGFVNFVCGPRIQPEYLAYWLRAKKPTLERLANGATFKEISRGTVRKLEINIPDRAEQARVVDLLSRAENIVRMRREAEQKAKEIIPALFLEMFGDPATNRKGWNVVKFSELGQCRLGKMLDKKKESGTHQRRYLRNVNVQWARIDIDDVLEMEILPEDREKFALRPGDLLICEGGEVGRAAIWDGRISECYFQKALHRLRPDPSMATAEYALWLLYHMARQGMLSSSGAHATIAHLTGVQLANLQVPLPPVASQRTFASRCREADILCERMTIATTTSEGAFQSLLAGVFSEVRAT